MTVNDMPTNYWQAQTMLKGKDERTIANNTRLRRVEPRLVELAPGVSESIPGIAVVLHRTAIVIHWEDGMVTLNSGGWQTVTTKARMNASLPQGIGVCQRDHRWYVVIRRTPHWLEFEFEDGDMWDTNPENVVR